MLQYIVRRLLWVIVLLFSITLITFIVFTVLPAGDPAALRAGRQPSAELLAAIREQLGLDEPKWKQFLDYVGGILPGFGDGINFGFSYQNNTDVLDQILDRIPTTMVLAGGAVVLWLAIGIPIGIVSAVKAGSRIDRALMALALIAISAPVYFLGLGALFLFAEDIGRFPLFPGNSAYASADTVAEKFTAMLLPWAVLAASFAAVYARFLRGGLIEVLNEDYIRTARAKGLSERTVIVKHGLRAALTPIVTLLGLDIGLLLGGAILTETVFNIQGIGRFAYEGIVRSDLPVIQGTVLFGAFFIVMMSLIVDIAYAFLDPRVRY